jgi:hypothetical protein
MDETEARVRQEYGPGYYIKNEGDHIHVQPPKGTDIRAAMGGGQDVLQGGGGADQLLGGTGGGGTDAYALLPEPAIAARPTRPEAVGAKRSELLNAAYDVMELGNPYKTERAQRMHEAGLAEQGKFNEAAVEREQALISDEFGAGNARWQQSSNNAEGNVYTSNQQLRGDLRSAAEKAKDRATQLQIAREGNASSLEQQRIQSEASIAAAQARLVAAGMPQNVATKFSAMSTKLNAVDFLRTKFKDDYTGLSNFLLGDKNIALNRVNPFGDADKADWWQTYSQLVNDVRKGLFGTALSVQEKAEFEKQVITARTDPKIAKRNLDNQMRILEGAAGNEARATAGKYGADNVREALGGRDITTLGKAPLTTTPAAAPATGGLTPAEAAELAALKAKHGR